MTAEAERDAATGGSDVAGEPPVATAGAQDDLFAERPELFVGAAFVGGMVAAQLLRLVGR